MAESKTAPRRPDPATNSAIDAAAGAAATVATEPPPPPPPPPPPATKVEPPPAPPLYRSVLDYNSDASLLRALMECGSEGAAYHQPVRSSCQDDEDQSRTSSAFSSSSHGHADDNDESCTTESSSAAAWDPRSWAPPLVRWPHPASSLTSDGAEESFASTPSLASTGRDWYLDNVRSSTSVEQTIEHEMKRLLTLKSYIMLDKAAQQARNTNLRRLSALAARLFAAPVAFVSVLDLGKTVFLATENLAMKEAPRNGTICAHALLSSEDFFEVCDLSSDERFHDLPTVNGTVGRIRYYAAQPLCSPEGYKLGLFGVVDFQTRPPMMAAEQANLSQFAQLAMSELIQHRALFQQQQERESAAQMLASVAHDLLTPLNGVQLSLSLLSSPSSLQQQQPPHDDGLLLHNLSEHQRECVATASSCAQIMNEICDSLRVSQDRHRLHRRRRQSDANRRRAMEEKVPSLVTTDSSEQPHSARDLPDTPRYANIMVAGVTTFLVRRLVDRLYQVIEAVPKAVPLVVTVDPSVPPTMHGPEFTMFRVALSLLTFCCERAKQGSIRLCIRMRAASPALAAGAPHVILEDRELVFECEDAGPDLSKQQNELFDYPSLHSQVIERLASGNRIDWKSWGLDTTAFHIRSMGGDFGLVCLHRDVHVHALDKAAATTRLWFSVPIIAPIVESLPDPTEGATRTKSSDDEKADACAITTSVPTPNRKAALIIDDSTIVRKMLAKALAKLGYETVQAENGMKGLEALKATMYDLVLLDFLMPVMDGLDCVRVYRAWEKAERPDRRQYIVGISAHASPEDVDRGYELGMDGYRSKPVTLDKLHEIDEAAVSIKEQHYRAAIKALGPDRPQKRARRSSTSSHSSNASETNTDSSNDHDNACLVACHAASFHQIHRMLHNRDWRAVHAANKVATLDSLKQRNWGAVILDGECADVQALHCVDDFRRWERENRVLRQRKVYVMTTGIAGPRAAGSISLVQLPAGIDGAISKPLLGEDIEIVVNASISTSSNQFDANDIVTR